MVRSGGRASDIDRSIGRSGEQSWLRRGRDFGGRSLEGTVKTRHSLTPIELLPLLLVIRIPPPPSIGVARIKTKSTS